MGDRTSAFRFETPNRHIPSLPDTTGQFNLAQFETSQLPLPTAPTGDQHIPQEPGHRPHMP